MPTIDLKLQVTAKIINRYKKLRNKAIEKMPLEDLRKNLSESDQIEFDQLISEMTNRSITPQN